MNESAGETADGVVRMGLGGRRRLGQDDVFEAAASAAILDPDLPDQWAEAEGRFVERLADDGAQKALIIVAPHGGGIDLTPTSRPRVLPRASRPTGSHLGVQGVRAPRPGVPHHLERPAPAELPLLRRVDRPRLSACGVLPRLRPVGASCRRAAPAYPAGGIDAIAAATAGSGVVVRAAEPNESSAATMRRTS